jgi:ParB family transcriptional regulator, chromosome partitioning protein
MIDKTVRSRGLGRGLSALMADVAAPEASPRRPDLMVAVELIQPNPDQPRRRFAPVELQELADSIRQHGVIQPLIVRPLPGVEGQFQIVAGERRWRAAQLAGLHQVPVIQRDYSENDVLQVAIIENIQRADLNALEEAAAYRSLIDRFGHTQDQLATALAKSRSHIANQMRLLTLPDDVQALVRDGHLTAGHARALIGHPHASALAQRIMVNRLTVRDAENLARKPFDPAQGRKPPPQAKDPDTVALENELTANLRMGVTIDQDVGKESGRLIFRYKNLGQLDDLLRALADRGLSHR